MIGLFDHLSQLIKSKTLGCLEDDVGAFLRVRTAWYQCDQERADGADERSRALSRRLQ